MRPSKTRTLIDTWRADERAALVAHRTSDEALPRSFHYGSRRHASQGSNALARYDISGLVGEAVQADAICGQAHSRAVRDYSKSRCPEGLVDS